MVSEETKIKATRLFNQINNRKSGLRLPVELKKKREELTREGIDLLVWAKSKRLASALSESSIGYLHKNLTIIIENKPIIETKKNTDGVPYNSYEEALEVIEKKLSEIEKVLSYSNTEIIANTKSITTQDKNSLSGCKWEVYYLYYNKELYGREMILCKGVVEVGDFFELGKHFNVQFKTPDIGNNVTYFGNYESLIKESEGIIIFNFESLFKGRKLHIKVYCRESSQQVLLGYFNTFEDLRIVSGKIMFYLPEGAKLLKPCHYSYVNNITEYSQLEQTIVDYLLYRNISFHGTFNDAGTINKLKKRISTYSVYRNKHSLFLEKPIPELLILSPQKGSLEPSSIGDTLELIQNDLIKQFPKNKLKVKLNMDNDFLVGRDYITEDSQNLFLPIENLESINSKRFVILFIDNVDKLSYSFLAFGWALAHCKVAILVCKEGSVSDTIINFNSLQEKDALIKIFTYDKGDTLENAWQNGNLSGNLTKYIRTNLISRKLSEKED